MATTESVLWAENKSSHPPKNTGKSRSSVSSISATSRSSTPATEVSEIPGSPEFLPPPETEETRRRRAQSDKASSELGKLLLQGWAMLGDQCPNTQCYGVPLVRPPRSGDGKNPRKECVICNSVYLTEKDWAGRERMVPMTDGELDATGTMLEVNIPNHNGKAPEIVPVAAVSITHLPTGKKLHAPLPSTAGGISPLDLNRTAVVNSALESSSHALGLALQSLSHRLNELSSSALVLDSTSIGATADAMAKVTDALCKVQALQHPEN